MIEIKLDNASNALGHPTPLLQEVNKVTTNNNAKTPAIFLNNFEFIFYRFICLKLH